jgi:hypothetical protein
MPNCIKCGLPVHYEYMGKDEGNVTKAMLLHDDYKKAWKVKNGIALNLHFVEVKR